MNTNPLFVYSRDARLAGSRPRKKRTDLKLLLSPFAATSKNELVMRPRSEHMAVASPHEQLTVISEPKLANLDLSIALASHRFDWIAPQFFDKHTWLHRSLTGIPWATGLEIPSS